MTNKDSSAGEGEGLARQIADNLFENGQGQRATRLVLVIDQHDDRRVPYLNIGGWCKQAVVDRITSILADTRNAVPPADDFESWLATSE